jgi:hypothetical protein
MSTVRRRFGRFDRELPVTLTVGEHHGLTGVTVNIGLGGVFVMAAVDAGVRRAGLASKLELPQPKHDGSKRKGRVMWSRATGEAGARASASRSTRCGPSTCGACCSISTLSSKASAGSQVVQGAKTRPDSSAARSAPAAAPQ